MSAPLFLLAGSAAAFSLVPSLQPLQTRSSAHTCASMTMDSRRAVLGAATAAVVGFWPSSANARAAAFKAAAAAGQAKRAEEEAYANCIECKLRTMSKQLDAIITNLEGPQDWVLIRREIGSNELGSVRALVKEFSEGTDRTADIARKRVIITSKLFEVDKFAYKMQCDELIGYKVGPDKELVDSKPLVALVTAAKEALTGIIEG